MLRQLSIEIFVVLLVGLVLGLVGPFSTYEFETPIRLAYWMVFGLVGYAIFRPLALVGRWLSEALGMPAFVGIGLAQLLAAVPMTLVVGTLLSGLSVTAALHRPALGLLYFQVWLIGFLTHGLFALIFREPGNATVEAPPPATLLSDALPDTPPAPRFADRLPMGFGPVHALRGEDHYVRAFGAERDVLILIRLRDAIAELEGISGVQVHRSWWVASDHVASAQRQGRGAVLKLASGQEVPVSRENLAQVKAAGWL